MTAPSAPQGDWVDEVIDTAVTWAALSGAGVEGAMTEMRIKQEATAAIRTRISEAEAAAELKGRIDELNKARKWSTKANTADQVWQQLTDRLSTLQARQADKKDIPVSEAEFVKYGWREADTSGREG